MKSKFNESYTKIMEQYGLPPVPNPPSDMARSLVEFISKAAAQQHREANSNDEVDAINAFRDRLIQELPAQLKLIQARHRTNG